MNKAVASALKNRLVSAPYVDLVAGLIYVQETVDTVTSETGQLRNVVYRYPVSDNVTLTDGADADCLGIGGAVKDVSPNTSRKGIIYFEDQGTNIPARSGPLLNFSSNLRLVCWLNTAQFVDELSTITIPARLMADIIGRLTGNPFNSDPLTRVKVSVRGIPAAGRTLFQQYTFNEAVSQYLMAPFDAFAIDLTVEFSISVNCANTPDAQTIPVC